MNLILIGYRCTGKTTVGKNLALKLQKTFVDADSVLVETYGVTISEIVETQGWDSFRDKETVVLKTICSKDNHVIATGGGAILRNENVDIMKNNSTVIWLRASEEAIMQRMSQDMVTDEQRPALTSKKLKQEVYETLADRNHLYEKTMDFLVDTDDDDISAVTDNIIRILNTLS